MDTRTIHRLFYPLLGLLLWVVAPLRAGDDDGVLNRMIQFPRSTETVYRLLGKVSEQTGYLFIYDSDLIQNERVVKLKAGTRTVRQCIYEIIGHPQLELRVVGNHILIYRTKLPMERSGVTVAKPDSLIYFTIEGALNDRYSQEPIAFATVSVVGTSIGSVANQNGKFRLHLPDSLRTAALCFSHLGYMSQTVDVALLNGGSNTLALEPKVIPLQEVVIRVANPARLLREMLAAREKNFLHEPVYLTSFYREGVERKNKFVNLTEAVFKIHKSSYRNELIPDQVKLLKMRTISNRLERDTFILKMKSGIDACLQLDLIKHLPDFLEPTLREDIYTYASSDITVIDNRVANVVSFEQRKGIGEPYYCGELYIDSENSALLQARFEVNPAYVTQAGKQFVERKGRDISITPQKVVYTVSYKQWQHTYYVNHVRGDLYFKIRKKKRLFGSFTLHTWFEMVTCKIDTEQVSRFGRKEKLPTRTIFADTSYEYDNVFWGDFNVIPPEEQLTEAMEKLSSKIEETL